MPWNSAVFDSTGRLKYGVPSEPTGPIWDDYTDLPGNIENFGAMLDGANDDTAAIQAAIDSEHAVFIPPGDIKLTETIYINKPKSITCFGKAFRSAHGINDNRVNPHYPGAQPRFYPTGNFDLFEVTANIDWRGGCFDFVNLPAPLTSRVFYIPMNWTGGHYGGSIRDVCAFGNELNHIAASDTDGATIVYVDFENETTTGARFENWYIEIESRFIRANFIVTDYNPGYSQNSCAHFVRSDFTKTYYAIQDEVSTDSFFTGMMQAKVGTYNTEAENLLNSAFKVQGTRNVIQDPGLQDFFKQDLNVGRPARAIDIADGNFITELKGIIALYDIMGDGAEWNFINSVVPNRTGRLQPDKDFTNSNLNASGNEANTRDKYEGTKVFISELPRFALGSNPTDDWVDSDGDVRNDP